MKYVKLLVLEWRFFYFSTFSSNCSYLPAQRWQVSNYGPGIKFQNLSLLLNTLVYGKFDSILFFFVKTHNRTKCLIYIHVENLQTLNKLKTTNIFLFYFQFSIKSRWTHYLNEAKKRYIKQNGYIEQWRK